MPRCRRLAPLALLFTLVAAAPSLAQAPPPFDGKRAFADLEAICRIGRRISGSEGMAQQQQMLADHFTQLGATCSFQEFDVPHPETGQPTRLKNLIVTWHPETTERVLLCCHYDTRPYPDRELLPRHRMGVFIGANDGASGVALLMELGRHMKDIKPRFGVDFVFFDAEEFIFDSNRDKYFHGSTWFANQYVQKPPRHRYVAGVLFDMVAGKGMRIYHEVNSWRYAREVTESVWAAAARLGSRTFIARRRHEVSDDHIPLNEIAKIPTTDLIDFDYPHWHTRNDLPSNCTHESLSAVGKVIIEWLMHLPDFTGSRTGLIESIPLR
jgi:glutaminyl-peptide cyclotransferase